MTSIRSDLDYNQFMASITLGSETIINNNVDFTGEITQGNWTYFDTTGNCIIASGWDSEEEQKTGASNQLPASPQTGDQLMRVCLMCGQIRPSHECESDHWNSIECISKRHKGMEDDARRRAAHCRPRDEHYKDYVPEDLEDEAWRKFINGWHK